MNLPPVYSSENNTINDSVTRNPTEDIMTGKWFLKNFFISPQTTESQDKHRFALNQFNIEIIIINLNHGKRDIF